MMKMRCGQIGHKNDWQFVHPKGTHWPEQNRPQKRTFVQIWRSWPCVSLSCTYLVFYCAWRHQSTIYVCQISFANSLWSWRYVFSKIRHPDTGQKNQSSYRILKGIQFFANFTNIYAFFLEKCMTIPIRFIFWLASIVFRHEKNSACIPWGTYMGVNVAGPLKIWIPLRIV